MGKVEEVMTLMSKLSVEEAMLVFKNLTAQECVYTGVRPNRPPYAKGKEPFATVVKEGSFDSAHNNMNIPGKCQNLHGHTYRYRVHVTQRVDYDSGIGVDFRALKKACKEKIEERLDHKYLNDALNFIPSAENVAIWIYKEIGLFFPVTKVELWENADSYVVIDEDSFRS